MTKLKKDCTEAEWQSIRKRARAYDAKERQKESRRNYMRDYMDWYTKTGEYRVKDNARYDDSRRKKQLTAHRKRAYGVPESEVEILMIIQGGRCGICNRMFSEIRKDGSKQVVQCVDHCHDTGLFRGLLCRVCNTMEGFIRRQGMTPTEYFQRMQAYLDEPPAQQERLG